MSDVLVGCFTLAEIPAKARVDLHVENFEGSHTRVHVTINGTARSVVEFYHGLTRAEADAFTVATYADREGWIRIVLTRPGTAKSAHDVH